jgi:hypothetical protein
MRSVARFVHNLQEVLSIAPHPLRLIRPGVPGIVQYVHVSMDMMFLFGLEFPGLGV